MLCVSYWELDYGLRCFVGPHLVLALVVGFPGVALFCVGVPLASALWLRHNAARGRLNTHHFSDRYGFLYEGARGGARMRGQEQGRQRMGCM